MSQRELDHGIIFGCYNGPHHIAGKFGVESAISTISQCKISRVKRTRLYELQHFSVHDWSLRLHQIVHQPVLSSRIAVKNSNCRIESSRYHLHADLAFQYTVGVVEHCIDRMGRKSVWM